jgi:threonine/homoserine/homoserine lactone efflux protein
MPYSSFKRNVQFVDQIIEVGPQSFYVGLPFMIASLVCILVAIFTKTSKKDRKSKKTAQQKKTFLNVFGAIFALIGLFLWIPFFKYLSIRY